MTYEYETRRTVNVNAQTKFMFLKTVNLVRAFVQFANKGPVARRMVSANHWSRGIETCMFPW